MAAIWPEKILRVRIYCSFAQAMQDRVVRKPITKKQIRKGLKIESRPFLSCSSGRHRIRTCGLCNVSAAL